MSHSLLYALSFKVLLSFVVASNCVIDLKPFHSNSSNPATAQCHSDCDLCNFTLANGTFEFGVVECLANVPCILKVTADYSRHFAMQYSTIDGTHASALTVQTTGPKYYTWYNAVLHAPTNRNPFRFETSAKRCVRNTSFYADGSGVVDIVINDDGVNDAHRPELYSMDVFASTADELNIALGNGSRFGIEENSRIECPEFGKCVWQSFGRCYNKLGVYKRVVNLIAFSNTSLQLICDNSQSCDGLFVHCKLDKCQMQYFADTWQCKGNLSLTYTEDVWHCPVLPMPTTTPLPVATSTKSSNGNTDNGNAVLFAIIAVFCVVFCCCSVAMAYLLGQRQVLKQIVVNERSTVQSTDEVKEEKEKGVDVAVNIQLIAAYPNDVFDCVDHRRGTAQLIAEQPEGEPFIEMADESGVKQESMQIEGKTRTTQTRVKTQAIDYDDEDELLYIDMGPNTVGHTEG